jgi:predicted Ser/Thr protein kinase
VASCTVCARPLPDDGSACSCADAAGSSATPTGTAPRATPNDTRRTPRSSGSRARSSGSGPGPVRFLPGDVLADRFRIVEPLGRGGMGEVYRADDLQLDQPVALKFLPVDLQHDEGRRERLRNEVKLARQVSHPTLCRVYDLGEADGLLFLSMEYVDGEDLASLHRRIGRLPAHKGLEIARQLCAGLAAAHARGILHRDLKPENIMLDGQGQVRVTDFGLAALKDSVSGDEVRSGTPAYMSPERLRGREVTVRSDVYSLGLVLYELFTGHRPYDGRTLRDLIRQHDEEPPLPPSQVAEDLDPAIESAILRCLEKNPSSRPRSALAVAALLPGGDPLAAALAAGETPSPELVAAAGESEGLRARWAGLLLAVTAACLAVLPWLMKPLSLFRLVPFEKTPAVLEDRARELLTRIGYAEPGYDSARGFAYDRDYINKVKEEDKSPTRWEWMRTGSPPVAQFWFRDSPRSLVGSELGGGVYWGNPPAVDTGMRGVRYDLRGRLVTFYAVPPQLETPAGEPVSVPDWSPLFAEAGLDRTRFRPAEPAWTPPFYSDVRAAWEGTMPERPELPLRVEAAGYRGRAVYFRQIAPWTRPERTNPFGFTRAERMAYMVAAAFVIALCLGAALLARHNLSLGRGDRAGALRLARYLFMVGLLAWLFHAQHALEAFQEFELTIRGVGTIMVVTALTWTLYLAIEPYVRRRWPHVLISWTRLLSGRVQDPVVGRDALIGVAAGAFMAVAIALFQRLPAAVGGPATPPSAYGLDAFLGARVMAADMLMAQLNAAMVAMVVLLMVMVGRIALRRQWLAITAALLVACLPECLASPLPLWLVLPLDMAVLAIPVLVLVRFGLLPAIVTFYVANRLVAYPLTEDLSSWTATPTLVLGALVLGLALWAARAALAGRPLFKGWLPAH